MKKTSYFFLGIAAVAVIIPALQEVGEICLGLSEWVRIHLQHSACTKLAEIEEIRAKLTEQETRAIGFSVENTDDYLEEDLCDSKKGGYKRGK